MNDQQKHWLIIGGGLLLRILYALWIQDQWMAEDAGGYYQDALWLLEGKQIAPFWPPAIPYYLAGIMALTMIHPAIAMGAMMLWFVAFYWSFVALGKRWLSPRNLIFLLIGFCLAPSFVHHSVSPLSHLPVATFLLICILLILRIKHLIVNRGSQSLILLLCILTGLTLANMGLTRPASLAIIPACLIFLSHSIPKCDKFKWLAPTILILVTFSLLTTWELYLHAQHNRWVGINDASALKYLHR